jgi:predicted  nucleic acid-binding Zn-ribbon protein
MGPTNLALVKLFQADQALREAQSRLDAATRDVRIQERRVNDLTEKHKLAQTKLRETQSQAGQLDLDLKSRDAHIERLRQQQQRAMNNKEYQAFLVEINTAKVDRNKVEDEAIKVLEQVERLQNELKDLTAQLDGEKTRLEQMRGQITDRIQSLQGEIDALRPEREAAAAAVSPKARDVFERMSERYEGESMAAIAKPDRRREEYVCTACNMELMTDVYNKLHSRDELVHCPSCRRLLYIPEDLTPETAVHKPKVRKEPKGRGNIPAAMNRQTSAIDVLRSMQADADADTETEGTEAAVDEAAAQPSASDQSDAPEPAGSENVRREDARNSATQ